MSIASEIQRIKTNIANAYTELENKGASIPEVKNSNNLASTIATVTTGGGNSEGIAINGKIEQKIASGNISKGNFVVPTEQSKSATSSKDRMFTSYFNYDYTNVFDGNDETYLELRNDNTSTTRYYYTACPDYTVFGIDKDTIITELSYKYKIYLDQIKYVENKTVNTYAQWYRQFDASSKISYTKIDYGRASHTLEAQTITDIVNVINETTSDVFAPFSSKYLGLHGSCLYCKQEKVRLYSIDYTIKYLDKGIVKTATVSTDEIVGIANSDGVEGDTIDVYVPDVTESINNVLVEPNNTVAMANEADYIEALNTLGV